MSGGSNSTNQDYGQELNDIDDQLAVAKRAGSLAGKHQKAGEARARQALQKIYEVWYPLLNSVELIEAYCQRHNIKCNSTQRDNRFRAPIEVCFSGMTPGSFTRYAKALELAEEALIKPDKLFDWFDERNGPDRIYLDDLEARKISKRTPLTHAPVTLSQPKPTAAPAPNAVPAPAGQQPAPLQPATPQLGIAAILVGIAQVRLLVTGKERHIGSTEGSGFLLRNAMIDGVRRLTVENVSTRYTFTTARYTLPLTWDVIGNREYVLSADKANRLARVFANFSEWSATADVDRLEITSAGGHRIVADALSDMDTRWRHMATPTAYGAHLTIDAGQAREFLFWQKRIEHSVRACSRQLRATVRREIETHRRIAANMWRQNRNVVNGQRTVMTVPNSSRHLDIRSFDLQMPGKVSMPRALDLNMVRSVKADKDGMPIKDINGKLVPDLYIEAHHFHTSTIPVDSRVDNMMCRLFSTQSHIAIGEDVRLPVLEIASLCPFLVNSGASARAQFVDTDETRAALVVEFAHGSGHVRYMIPTIKSASLLRRNACQPLTRTIPVASIITAPTVQDISSDVEQQFGAYIISFRPEDEEKWQGRRANFLQQLDWWIQRDVTINLLLSGWSDEDEEAFNRDGNGILDEIKARFDDTAIRRVAGQPLILNRIDCLERFYSSTHDWGIMMDDDAILETKYYAEDRVSFFEEMARNKPEKYGDVDVFYPFWDKKWPRHPNFFWKDVAYKGNHIFHRDPNLKGSMFVVRNFRKEKRIEVFPDASYLIHGEDTLFATEAMAQGHTVMMCSNIILRELEGPSYFDEQRKANMRIAAERIACMYQHLDLRMMNSLDPNNKTLNRRKFFKRCWHKPKSQTVPKP